MTDSPGRDTMERYWAREIDPALDRGGFDEAGEAAARAPDWCREVILRVLASNAALRSHWDAAETIAGKMKTPEHADFIRNLRARHEIRDQETK